MDKVNWSSRLHHALFGGLMMVVPFVDAGGAVAAPYQAFMREQCESNSLCRLDFPAVPNGRRREITFASCEISLSAGEVTALNLFVGGLVVHASLIPVELASTSGSRFASNDQILLHVRTGTSVSVLALASLPATIFNLACLLSGETIVTE
jgi:hypothetical protein